MTDQTLAESWAEVSTALSRIEKRGTAPAAMGGFPFVRESDVIEALKPELDTRGIVLRPDVELLRLDTYPRQGKDMPTTVATVAFALWAVRGTEEHLIGRTLGQGADTQDKAVGKATTAAKKQLFLVAFAIPTGDDPDSHAIPERTRRAEPYRRSAPSDGLPAMPIDPAGADAGDGSDEPEKAVTTPAEAGAGGGASPVPAPADIQARYVWADRLGWDALRLDEAAVDATGQTVMEMDSPQWQAFALTLKAGALDPPPKAGTDGYKRLQPTDKAKARAYWQRQAVEAVE